MKTWTPSPIRTLGSPRLHGEPCFQVYSVWFLLKMLHLYFMLKCFSLLCRENKFSSRQVGDLHWFAVTWKVNWREKETGMLYSVCNCSSDPCLWPSCRDGDVNSDKSYGPTGEKRRELVRSQTLPRNIGAQSRRSIFERLESETNNKWVLFINEWIEEDEMKD